MGTVGTRPIQGGEFNQIFGDEAGMRMENQPRIIFKSGMGITNPLLALSQSLKK